MQNNLVSYGGMVTSTLINLFYHILSQQKGDAANSENMTSKYVILLEFINTDRVWRYRLWSTEWRRANNGLAANHS